jgi:excisionase family DNA binding protein
MTPLLTTQEVADVLKVNRKTVLDLIATKRLIASNISGGDRNGKRYRIRQADLDRYVESGQYA